jgi:hypothetical protein
VKRYENVNMYSYGELTFRLLLQAHVEGELVVGGAAREAGQVLHI